MTSHEFDLRSPALAFLAQIPKESYSKLLSFEEHTWSDTSLGIREPGCGYGQAFTSGYIATLEVDGKVRVFHTNKSFSIIKEKLS